MFRRSRSPRGSRSPSPSHRRRRKSSRSPTPDHHHHRSPSPTSKRQHRQVDVGNREGGRCGEGKGEREEGAGEGEREWGGGEGEKEGEVVRGRGAYLLAGPCVMVVVEDSNSHMFILWGH